MVRLMVTVWKGGVSGFLRRLLGLLLLRGLRKNGCVRINTHFYAPASRTLDGVGIKAFDFWRRKKGDIDRENCGVKRSNFFCFLFHHRKRSG